MVSSSALAAATSGGPHLLELVSGTNASHQYGVEHFGGSDGRRSDWIRGPILVAMQPTLGAVVSVNPRSRRESGDMDMHWPLLHLLESCGDHGDTPSIRDAFNVMSDPWLRIYRNQFQRF